MDTSSALQNGSLRRIKALFSSLKPGKVLSSPSHSKIHSPQNTPANAANPSAPQANGRAPHSVPSPLPEGTAADYVLKRDYMGSCRLNLQYYLWKETLDFDIHPSIDIKSLGPSPRVADIATGTGIWLLKSRKMLPSSAQLDGFDIDLGQAPHPQWMPSNVSLRQWDMLGDIPTDLIGIYDVVHIRLVMLVIKDNDPIPLIQNLRKLLKPGGYLQWDEVNQMGKSIVKVSNSVKSDGINAMFRVDIPEGVKGSDDWQTDLPTTLESQRFHSAQQYQFDPPATSARYWHDMYTLAWDEFLSRNLGSRAPQALIAADQGMNEARNGAAISMPILVWVARAS